MGWIGSLPLTYNPGSWIIEQSPYIVQTLSILLSQSPEYLDHRHVPPYLDFLTQFVTEGKGKFALAPQCPVFTVRLFSSFHLPVI